MINDKKLNEIVQKINNKFNTFKFVSVDSIYKTKKSRVTYYKVTLDCPVHGLFNTTYPSLLYTKFGCEKCSHDYRTKNKIGKIRATQEYIDKNYNFYDKTKYKITPSKNPNKVFVTCYKHTTVERHINTLYNCICVDCKSILPGNALRISFQSFKELLSPEKINKFTYIEETYIDYTFNTMKIICPLHGEFWQIPSNHLQSIYGCLKCIPNRSSKKEKDWLDSLNLPDICTQYFVKYRNKKYYIDGYDAKNHIAYEYLGDFWHGNLKIFPKEKINNVSKKSMLDLFNNTENKFKNLTELGFTIIYKWESDPLNVKRIFKGKLEC